MRPSLRRGTVSHVGCLFATFVGCPVPVFDSVVANVCFCHARVEADRTARGSGGENGIGGDLVDPVSLELPVSIHASEVSAVPA